MSASVRTRNIPALVNDPRPSQRGTIDHRAELERHLRSFPSPTVTEIYVHLFPEHR